VRAGGPRRVLSKRAKRCLAGYAIGTGIGPRNPVKPIHPQAKRLEAKSSHGYSPASDRPQEGEAHARQVALS
jgi:hypothetical protein